MILWVLRAIYDFIMKRRKLISGIEYDFDLLGIISGLKGFQLAWNLNQAGPFHFVKSSDIQLQFSDNSRIAITNFEDKSELYHYTLIQNKLVSSNTPRHHLFLSDLKEFDFFLKISTSVDDFDIDQLISSLRKCPVINYLVKLDLSKVKQKENLIY